MPGSNPHQREVADGETGQRAALENDAVQRGFVEPIASAPLIATACWMPVGPERPA